MRLSSLHRPCVVALLAVSACGDAALKEPDFGAFTPFDLSHDFTAKKFADAGSTTGCGDMGAGKMGSGANCLPNDPNGPTVAFVMPMANDLVIGSAINVSVTVMPGAKKAAIDFVDVFVVDSNRMTRLMSTKEPSVYVGVLDLAGIPTSPIKLGATARDLDMLNGSASIDVLRDAGPVIVAASPKKQFYRGSAPISFFITNPTMNPDLDPEPTATRVEVNKVAVPVTQDDSQAPRTYLYSGTLDFHADVFGQALSGDQVMHIFAKNKKNTESELTVPFTVKEQGPTIVIEEPKVATFVGGVVTVSATITDVAGVDAQTVVAVWGGNTKYSVPLVAGNDPTKFSAQFDTKQLGIDFISPLLSVRAADKLGNVSEQSVQVFVDNVAPSIDLDPPPVHFIRKDKDMGGKDQIICSNPLDPVGDDAANDGDIVNQLFWLRARIGDHGNIAKGQAVEWVSLVDPASVKLYIIRAIDAPIIVDTKNDGTCDDINPTLVPTNVITAPNQAIVTPLSPLPVGGKPDYSPSTGDAVCMPIGKEMEKPGDPICNLTGQLFWMAAASSSMPCHEPAIWTIPPVMSDPMSAFCGGLQFDAANNIPDGPICVAVKASDSVHNRNVSRVLRLCLDRKGKGICDTSLYQTHGAPFAANHAQLPNCTGTIQGGKVNKGVACKPGVRYNEGSFLVAFPPNEKNGCGGQ